MDGARFAGKRDTTMIFRILQPYGLALLLCLATPAHANTKFDGKWQITVTAGSGETMCHGFLNKDTLTIANSRLSGALTHENVGYLEVSGTIVPDGTMKDLEANSSEAFVSMTGSVSGNRGDGKWTEERSGCEGTWEAKKLSAP